MSTVTHPNLQSISVGVERRLPQAWCLLVCASCLYSQHRKVSLTSTSGHPLGWQRAPLRYPPLLSTSEHVSSTPSSDVSTSLLILATLHRLTSNTKTQQHLDQLGLRASLAQRWMSPFVFSQLKREGSFRFNSCSGLLRIITSYLLLAPFFLIFPLAIPATCGGKNHTSYTRNVRFLPKALQTVIENVNPLCLSNSQLSEFFPSTHPRVFFFFK